MERHTNRDSAKGNQMRHPEKTMLSGQAWTLIHPLLFAIYPVIFLASRNIQGIDSWKEVLLVLLFMLGGAGLSFLFLLPIVKSFEKAALLTSLYVLLFCSFGHISDALEGKRGLETFGYFELGIIWTAVFTAGTAVILKLSKEVANGSARLMTYVSAILVAFSLLIGGLNWLQIQGTMQEVVPVQDGVTPSPDSASNPLKSIEKKGKATQPDIYYLIVDAYGSQSTLSELYAFSNDEFLSSLTQIGFTLAHKSHSNYAYSALSVASSLNMEYLDYMTEILGEQSRDRKLLYDMIRNNKVARFLRSKGYEWINLGYMEDAGNANSFLLNFMRTTALTPFSSYLVVDRMCEGFLNKFRKVEQLAGSETPIFVYAHFQAGHPPFLFQSDGQKVKTFNLTFWGSPSKRKDQYVNQITFTNKKIKALIDAILARSKRQPIIIVQGDHGPEAEYAPGKLPTETYLRERMRILNAYYLPGAKDLIYDSITPVNTFRLILNYYFGTQFELLEDKSYHSNYWLSQYRFVDVTGIVCNDQ